MTESPTTSVGAGLSRTMTRGSEELIQQIHAFLQSHPKEAASLGIGPAAAPPPAPPAHATAGEAHPRRERSTRSLWRRSFYTAVVAGLAMLAINVTHLAYLEHTTRGAQELVVEEVRQNRGWLGRVVVVQALIITFNVILTYRGVKVWMLLRRIKVGQLLRQVKQRLVPVRWVIRQVRRTGTVLNWATVPLRLPIRAARRAVSQRNALRKAEAAKRAARIGSVFAAGFASKAMLAA